MMAQGMTSIRRTVNRISCNRTGLALIAFTLAVAVGGGSRKNEAIAEFETALRLEPSLDSAKKDLNRLK